jgi:hypothetical protein
MGGRLLGHATLAFRDEYLALDERVAVSVTDDPAAVLDLEKACPPDDVAEVGLADMSRALVTLDELDQPTAGAGYAEWEQIIAHLGVLTPPAFRRRGFGQVAAALATNDALDLGLVPQWRAPDRKPGVPEHRRAARVRRSGLADHGRTHGRFRLELLHDPSRCPRADPSTRARMQPEPSAFAPTTRAAVDTCDRQCPERCLRDG